MRIESEILLTVLGRAQRPPVDLYQVAVDLGVQAVRPTHGAVGFTDFSTSKPTVYLGPAHRRERVRFVFAHELAHIMLRNTHAVRLLNDRNQTHLLSNEEMLAQKIAATLLIPDEWVEGMRSARITLASLRNFARLAEVSRAMIVTRLADAGEDIALLQWQRGSSSWHVIDRLGVPRHLHGKIEPSLRGRMTLDELDEQDRQVVIDASISRKRLRIRGEVRRKDEYVAQLIRPSRDIWLASRPGF
jgi:hypothetical protein